MNNLQPETKQLYESDISLELTQQVFDFRNNNLGHLTQWLSQGIVGDQYIHKKDNGTLFGTDAIPVTST